MQQMKQTDKCEIFDCKYFNSGGGFENNCEDLDNIKFCIKNDILMSNNITKSHSQDLAKEIRVSDFETFKSHSQNSLTGQGTSSNISSFSISNDRNVVGEGVAVSTPSAYSSVPYTPLTKDMNQKHNMFTVYFQDDILSALNGLREDINNIRLKDFYDLDKLTDKQKISLAYHSMDMKDAFNKKLNKWFPIVNEAKKE